MSTINNTLSLRTRSKVSRSWMALSHLILGAAVTCLFLANTRLIEAQEVERSPDGPTNSTSSGLVVLEGAGASFPNSLYQVRSKPCIPPTLPWARLARTILHALPGATLPIHRQRPRRSLLNFRMHHACLAPTGRTVCIPVCVDRHQSELQKVRWRSLWWCHSADTK